MKQIIMLTMLALGMICINGSAQTKKLVRRTVTQVRKNTSTSKPVQKDSREYKVEDGFEWYLVCKNGKYCSRRNNISYTPFVIKDWDIGDVKMIHKAHSL